MEIYVMLSDKMDTELISFLMEACIKWEDLVQVQNPVERHNLLWCMSKILRLQEQTEIYQMNMS